MTPEHFEQLLIDAGLQPRQSPQFHGIAFSMSLHVTTEIPLPNGASVQSTRYMGGWMEWEPKQLEEFEQMTAEQAKKKIETYKSKLERVARTKTLSY